MAITITTVTIITTITDSRRRVIATSPPLAVHWLQPKPPMMTKISYSGYCFPPEIIQQAIWLSFRFTLSFRDAEDLLAERGILVSSETVRLWVNHLGPRIEPTRADEGQSPIRLVQAAAMISRDGCMAKGPVGSVCFLLR